MRARRVRACATAAAAILLSSCGGHPTSPSASALGVARTARVMTFNIQHGIDGTERYQLQTAIDTIARVDPDLVALQEVTRNHPFYNCDDQPAAIANGLSAQTGRRWVVYYKEQWFTSDRSCMQSGRGDAAESEGLAFLAPETLTPPSFLPLWNGGLGLAVRGGAIGELPVAVTHLAAQASGAADRVRQIGALVPWMATLGDPRILVGDFNASATASELQPILSTYRDAWADALRNGTARGRMDGITHRGIDRIDYIFYSPSDRLQLLWAETVDTLPLIGREASDHRPVVAAFSIR